MDKGPEKLIGHEGKCVVGMYMLSSMLERSALKESRSKERLAVAS